MTDNTQALWERHRTRSYGLRQNKGGLGRVTQGGGQAGVAEAMGGEVAPHEQREGQAQRGPRSRAGEAWSSKPSPACGSPEAQWGRRPSRQAVLQSRGDSSLGPRKLQLPGRAGHQECHPPAASRLTAPGKPTGRSVTFQHKWQGLMEPWSL